MSRKQRGVDLVEAMNRDAPEGNVLNGALQAAILAESNGNVHLSEGGTGNNPSKDSLVAENESLRAELAKVRMQLKLVREERCLDALQAVLLAHRCELVPLPNGQFQVLANE